MFSFFKRPRTKRTAVKPGRPRLSIEQLEQRNCPAPVISGFVASPGAAHVWTFQGQVADANASVAGLTVNLGGLLSLTGQTATVAANGSFSVSVTLQDGESGTATAQTRDALDQDSNQAMLVMDPPASQPPAITNFGASQGALNMWTFQGQVTDANAPGMTVRFGGLPSLGAQMATVNASGWFYLTIELQDGEDGTATAQTTNSFGLDSNVAEALVAPA